MILYTVNINPRLKIHKNTMEFSINKKYLIHPLDVMATAFTFEEKRKKGQKEYQEKALVQVQHET